MTGKFERTAEGLQQAGKAITCLVFSIILLVIIVVALISSIHL